MVGHAGHRDRRAGRLAARGERDVEQPRGALGVVVEELVEVAHPVEDELVRMLRLDAQILLHHRRVRADDADVRNWQPAMDTVADYKAAPRHLRRPRVARAARDLRHNALRLRPLVRCMPVLSFAPARSTLAELRGACGRSP